MSLIETQGRPVHIPANPNAFAFDGEVSKIFPDMAKRSIPNFYEAHDAHAKMLFSWMRPGASILDVGASRGAFFEAIKANYPDLWYQRNIQLCAIENSEPMCDYLHDEYPFVDIRTMDITQPPFQFLKEQHDVVCCHYVLQFLPPEVQMDVLLKLFSMVKPGGVFIFGHKSAFYGDSGAAAHDRYMQFRVDNGYTRAEIQAKTRALAGSMFPMDHGKLMSAFRLNMSEVQETFRFMMFSTIFAVR